MPVSTAIASENDIRAFIEEYFQAWSGTDEDLILSYYSETSSLEIPGTIIKGKVALRDQFVRPFVAGFPGNRHVVKNMIFGKNVVVVKWSFEAAHKGPFAGTAATGTAVKSARLRGVSIRSDEATGHRGPYLFRRHDITQANFITPASIAPEPSDIVVCHTGLSKVSERA